jgi:hypothetical protein
MNITGVGIEKLIQSYITVYETVLQSLPLEQPEDGGSRFL